MPKPTEGEYARHPDAGMILDFACLDEIVHPLLEVLDHHNLNDPPTMRHPIFQQGEWWTRSTAEELVVTIVHYLRRKLAERPDEGRLLRLSRVRLYETEKCYAEWTP